MAKERISRGHGTDKERQLETIKVFRKQKRQRQVAAAVDAEIVSSPKEKPAGPVVGKELTNEEPDASDISGRFKASADILKNADAEENIGIHPSQRSGEASAEPAPAPTPEEEHARMKILEESRLVVEAKAKGIPPADQNIGLGKTLKDFEAGGRGEGSKVREEDDLLKKIDEFGAMGNIGASEDHKTEPEIVPIAATIPEPEASAETAKPAEEYDRQRKLLETEFRKVPKPNISNESYKEYTVLKQRLAKGSSDSDQLKRTAPDIEAFLKKIGASVEPAETAVQAEAGAPDAGKFGSEEEERERNLKIIRDAYAERGTFPEGAISPVETRGSLHDDYAESIQPRKEGTRAEWREKLGNLILKVTEGPINAVERTLERFTKSKNYLDKRAKAMDAEAGEMSGKEKWFRKLGENYNKLSFREKLGIGVVLGAGAVVTGGISIYIPYALTALLGAQRAAGMSSMFQQIEKDLKEKKVGEGSSQIIGRKERAMLDAMLYTFAMGFAIKEGIEVAEKYEPVVRAREWLGEKVGFTETTKQVPHDPTLGGESVRPHGSPSPEELQKAYDQAKQGVVEGRVPGGTRAGFQAEVRAVDNAIPEPRTTGFQAEIRHADMAMEPKITGFQAEVRGADNAIEKMTVARATPDMMPSVDVEVKAGKGYEWMVKRVWEDLHTKGLDPSKYAEGSDIRRLIEADANSIDKVVHQIAADPKHGFYNADGTSVRIDLGSHMTVNADGNIQLGDIVKAPEGTPTTPPYHPEASAPPTEDAASSGIRETSQFFFEEKPLDKPETEASPAPAQAPESSGEATPPPAEAPPPAKQGSFWTDGQGQPVVDSEGNPVRSRFEQTLPQAEAPAGSVINSFGLTIPTNEPHIYAGADAGHTFVYGGSPAERANAIAEYLKANPNTVVFASDDSGQYRIPWHLVEEKAVPAATPIRTTGFFGLFSTWMEPPGPEDLQKLIK